MSPQPETAPQTTIRRARAEDAEPCGRICYNAFNKINLNHGFPPDFPAPGVPVEVLSMMFTHPGFWCVVAERDGRIVGSNCLDERSPVFGVGPITVDPEVQNAGVGRLLMQAVLDRSRERNTPSVRLLQAAFHNRSLSLYTKLGFDAREPISVMQGAPLKLRVEGCAVRKAALSDLPAIDSVCERVHGHNRSGEVKDSIAQGSAVVVERHGRITGYASAMAFFGHAVGETNPDLQALIGAAEGFGGPGILVPTRNAALFRWCLEHGLHVVEPLTLMTTGLYTHPAGAYLPSISF